MYIKAIKFTDYNGEEKVKNFYFNLTKTEIARMQLGSNGDLKEVMKKMINESDNKKILQFFESIVLGAYGEKSADGETFLKSEEIRNKFQCHPAYDALFMELIEGGETAMADFIKAIIPSEFSAEIDKQDKDALKKELIPSVENGPTLVK